MKEFLVEHNKDALTGVYNRYFLKEFMQFELFRKKRYGGHLSVVICDLDNFKTVNDSYGHLKGDEILVYFARLLERSVRSSDIVIRYGGDEFVLILTDTPKSMAHFVSERIINEVNESDELKSMGVGVSIGISGYPEDGTNLEELLKKADQALYDSKRKGKGRFTLFQGDVNLKPAIPAKEFTGREDVLKLLKEFIEHGEKKVILITGPAGIGKTRLVEEVLKSQERVIRGSSSLFGRRIPYFEIKESLKTLYKQDRTRFQAILSRTEPFVANTVSALLPHITEKETPPVEDKFTLFEGIKRFITAYFDNKPFVMFIDDVQWVSPETTQILLYLIEQLPQIKLIMVKRIEETSEDLKKFIDVLENLSQKKHIEIPPLNKDDTGRLLKLILGEHLPPGLTDYIIRHSGGNPFFIEEIIRSLFEEGYLEVIEGEWVFRMPDTPPVSKSINDVVFRKLRNLPKAATRILEIMALWDAPVDVHTLSILSGIDEGEILFNMDKMEYLKLISQENNLYYLSAGAIRNIIVKEMTVAKKTAIHRKIASTLEHLFTNNTEYIEKIGYHYYEGRDYKKALHYLKIAYERAEKIKALNIARELLEKFLSIEEDPEKQLRLAALQLETESGEKAGDTLLKYIKKYGPKPEALMLLSEIEERKGNIEEAIKLLDSIKTSDESIKYNILKDKAWLLMLLGRYGEAESILKDVLEHFKGRNYDIYYSTLHYLATLYYSRGQYDKAIEVAKEGISYFEKNDKVPIGALNTLALSYRSLGQYDRALDAFEKAIEYARKKGLPHSLATLLGNAALIYWDKYQYKKAQKYFEEGINILTSMAAFDNAAFHMNNMIEMLMESGMIELGELSTDYIRKRLDRIHAFLTGTSEKETRLLTYINEVEYASLVGNQKERLYWAGELLNLSLSIEDGALKCYGLTTVEYALIDNCLLKDAMKIARKIKTISKSMDTLEWEIYTLSAIYLIMKKAGKDEKAKNYIKKLESLEKELGDDVKLILYERLFRAMIDTKEIKRAKKYYRKLVKMLKDLGAKDKLRYIEFLAQKHGI